jgi:hypothetical protein
VITARLIFKDAKPLLFKEHLKKDSEGKHFVSDAADIKYLHRKDRDKVGDRTKLTDRPVARRRIKSFFSTDYAYAHRAINPESTREERLAL